VERALVIAATMAESSSGTNVSSSRSGAVRRCCRSSSASSAMPVQVTNRLKQAPIAARDFA
jgi:hypothetical protein